MDNDRHSSDTDGPDDDVADEPEDENFISAK